MTPDDAPVFERELSAMFQLLSAGKTELSVAVSALWFRVLTPYPLPAVLEAIDTHLRHPDTGRTLPIPGDIVKHINASVANDGRPGADEAWAIAVQSADEGATVVWTDEIAAAWDAARHVLRLGDEVGARVAFRDAYNRIVVDARCARRPMQWQVALGHDTARRADALRLAAELGRLPRGDADAFAALPAPRAPVLLLTDAGGSGPDGEPSQAQREALAALRAALEHPVLPPSADALAREHTAQLKARAADKVAEFVESNKTQGAAS